VSLVIETGQGVADANSFVTVAEADRWLAAMGDEVWAALPEPEKEAHLVQGALYVSNGQIYYFSGARKTVEQTLAWPRTNGRYRNGGPVVPSDKIPNDVKLAQIVAAKASAHGFLPVTTGGGQGEFENGRRRPEVQSEKVGDLSVSYFDPLRNSSKGEAAVPPPLGGGAVSDLGLPAVTGILAPLLNEDIYMPGRPPIVGPSYAQPTPRNFYHGMNDARGAGIIGLGMTSLQDLRNIRAMMGD
jgi:hypothetical protein